ncbi:MAG: multiheme c-type cytochrome [Polyangia bacterium]
MLGLGVAFAAQLFANGLAPVDPGSDAASARECEACHPAEHAEWSASRHGRAFTNPIFQREYSAHPDEWCVHCHAPLTKQLEEVRSGAGVLAAEGVNCIACHVRRGRILAARKRPGSPHATDVRAGFGGPSFCAGCHQFNFPQLDNVTPHLRTRVTGYTSHPMQNTVAEHAAGPHASEPCRSCHASPAEHAYPGGHDAAMLERALSLDVCRRGRDVVATVTNRGAGHRVPTGDVHRHLALRLWKASAPEKLQEHFMLRHFEPLADGGKALVEDTGLAPGQSRAYRATSRALGGEDDEPVSIELRFVYTIDEFPLHELGERAFTTVAKQMVLLPQLPSCGAAAQRR